MSAMCKAGFAAARRRIVQEPFPEAGEGSYVCLRELSAADLRVLQAEGKDGDESRFAFRVLAASICDDAGALVFESADDAEATLSHVGYSVLNRLAKSVFALSSIGTEGN